MNAVSILMTTKLWKVYLLQLEEFGSLHKMFQLQSTFGHVMRLAPFLDPRDVILYLHCWKDARSDFIIT